ncbi:GNAT family N-acetyltransferase [Dyella sp. LX-66]|uniref:GNAT family N-acetyltransferase n=1 Tax=unclassified Dyella TaxID=2634549 RepID=UPI001BDFB68E|nr:MULTISPECIES: GNAT family N-acetyltransferase [unclassified Dyella]MBT2118128.1 GNAT family N-acetyltransferase [Dyella sp. LX-1]MBT2138846.1 GNAT family N-acetyltransferase [Dyella sp. LX-66]
MLLNNAGLVVEDCVVLGLGEPWDIFFFVEEVVAGARKGHFNNAHCSMAYVLRTLGFACAKAMLAKRLPWHRAGGRTRFVVARKAGKALGAMLLEEAQLNGGEAMLAIKYLVVDSSARRLGIGKLLVEYARRRAPAGGVECFCTDFSRGMQRLLKRQGFVRTHRAKEIQLNEDSRIAVPARFLWTP